MVEVFLEMKDLFQFKDLEKIAPQKKGILSGKEVL